VKKLPNLRQPVEEWRPAYETIFPLRGAESGARFVWHSGRDEANKYSHPRGWHVLGGGTVWKGRAAMRISVSNWSTTDEDVERSIAAIVRCVRNRRNQKLETGEEDRGLVKADAALEVLEARIVAYWIEKGMDFDPL
jgi:hypothetical protein